MLWLCKNNKNKRILPSAKPIHFAILFIALVISLNITVQSNTASAKKFDEMNVSEQAKSYQYYMALSDCIEKHSLSSGWTSMKDVDAEGFNWFAAAPIKDGSDGGTSDMTSDPIKCRGNPNEWIKSAMDLWGYSKGIDAVCDFGLVRKKGSESVDCKGAAVGTDTPSATYFFAADSSGHFDLASAQKSIKDKVYGGKDPVLTNPIKYDLYRKAFFTICLGSSNPAPYTGSDLTGFKSYTIQNVDNTGKQTKTNYQGVQDGSFEFRFFLDSRDLKNTNCRDAEKVLQDEELAKTYSTLVGKNLENPDIPKEGDETAGEEDSTSEPKTCGGEVANIGWIICPVVTALTGLNDLMWDLTSKLLNVSPLEQTGGSSGVYAAWGVMRNLANVAFVIVFLIIIFSQTSSIGISNYGIKKLLPKLIIGALLVNMSFLIVQVAVDIANIAGSSIFTILKEAPGPKGVPSWSGLVTAALAPTLVAGGVAAGLVITGGALIWMIALFAIMGCLTLLAAFLTLIFRQGVILILVIIAPLAFVAYLLPNTEKWFTKWKDMLVQMLMLYPIAAIVFGGSQFASTAIYNSDKGWWTTLMSLIILCLPLFSLPFLATKGGAILSKVNGTLTGLAQKLRNPISGYTKSQGDLSKEKYLATEPGRYNFGKRAHFALNRRAGRRRVQTESYKKQSEEMFTEDLKNNTSFYTDGVTGNAARSHIEGTVAKLEAQELTSAIQSLERSIATERAAGNNTDQYLINRANGKTKDSTGAFVDDPSITLLQQKAAVYSLAAQGRADQLRDMRNSNQVAPAAGETAEARTVRERKLQTVQEAIQANAGKLAGKAPDLVKNSDDGAFNRLTAESLAGFSAGTGKAMVEHLDKLRTASISGGDAKKTYDKAIASFNSSVDQISKNSDLMGKFEGPTGESIISAINAHSSLKTEMTGASHIDSSGDFKIKPIPTSAGNTSGGGI